MHRKHALLALCLLCAVAANGVPEADYSVYHTKDAIFQIVHDIVGTQQQPHALAVSSETRVEGNYTSDMTVVTVEPGGLTGNDEKKIRMLLNFGQHGRELITSEVAVRLLALLASDAELVKFCALQGIPAARLVASLKHIVLKVVPMENVRGRERVEAGEPCLRKNGRGVDTNRNWAVHWGFKEPDYDPEEEFPGDRPFSEPEAEMLRALAASFRPHAWVNVHSGMEALFMPYDHRAEVPEGPGPTAALAILQELNRTACGGRCAVGSGGKAVGYLAHGTATDYMYEVLHVPMPFTWEIYGDEGAPYSECFRMFNPSGAEEVRAVVDAWAAAFLRLVLLLPTHPDVARDVPAMVAAGQQLPAEEAAAAANETLAAADVKVVDRGGSSAEDGSFARRGAVAMAKQQQGAHAWSRRLGSSSPARTAALWCLCLSAILLFLVVRRRLWRKFAPRGRVHMRTRRPVVAV